MKKIQILCVMILMVMAFSLTARAELAFEVDVQIDKLYDMEVFGQEVEIESQAQTYLLGADLDLGNLRLTPKVGVRRVELEVAEMIDIETDLGLAAGIDVELDVFGMKGLGLVLTGSYLYSQLELDNVNGNDIPLRNELRTHLYEVGGKIVANELPIPIKPYIGCVYSDGLAGLSTDNLPMNIEIDAEAAKNFGLRLGAQGSPTKNSRVAIEVGLIDEKSVQIAGAIKF